jgi:transcription antitermination factor NusG
MCPLVYMIWGTAEYYLCRRVLVVQHADVIRVAGTDKLEKHTAKSVGYSINFTSGYQIILSVYVREAWMPVDVLPYLTIFISIRFLLQPFPHLQQDISRLRVLGVRLLPSSCCADSLCRHKVNENVLRFSISYWYFCLNVNVLSYR